MLNEERLLQGVSHHPWHVLHVPKILHEIVLCMPALLYRKYGPSHITSCAKTAPFKLKTHIMKIHSQFVEQQIWSCYTCTLGSVCSGDIPIQATNSSVDLICITYRSSPPVVSLYICQTTHSYSSTDLFFIYCDSCLPKFWDRFCSEGWTPYC